MTTSGRKKSVRFCAHCYGNSVGGGVIQKHDEGTKGSRTRNSARDTHASTSNTFPPTVQNSTLRKVFGLCRRRNWPTAVPRTSMNSWKASSARSMVFADHQRNYGGPSCSQSFLFFCANPLHYLM